MAKGRRSTKRPYGTEHEPLDVDRIRGGRSTEHGPDGEWTVQRVRGSDRAYRCPGCDQLIGAGVGHVVAWPGDHLFGADAALAERRHWHPSCWEARSRRRPAR